MVYQCGQSTAQSINFVLNLVIHVNLIIVIVVNIRLSVY